MGLYQQEQFKCWQSPLWKVRYEKIIGIIENKD